LVVFYNNGVRENCEIDKLNVSQLKDYLRLHKEYVTGKKAELVKRAKGLRKIGRDEVCDEVELWKFQRRQTEKLVTPLGEILPHPTKISSGSWTEVLMEVPNISDADIYNYFVLKMQIKKPLRAKTYVEDRHVYGIMYSEISSDCEHCFVKCKCMPSIPTADAKANPDHDVWVCLSKVTGAVHSAECDCTAGYVLFGFMQ
jgi:hypothetical protein